MKGCQRSLGWNGSVERVRFCIGGVWYRATICDVAAGGENSRCQECKCLLRITGTPTGFGSRSHFSGEPEIGMD